MDGAQLGPVSGIDTGTRGTEYFDSFVSRRSTYIGMVAPSGVAVASQTNSSAAMSGTVVLAAYRPNNANQPVNAAKLALALTAQPILYTYDALGRLTYADYGGGVFFQYTYDAVGNRLTETTQAGTTTYTYDNANRIATVNGVAYTWYNNGNLQYFSPDSERWRANKYNRSKRSKKRSHRVGRCNFVEPNTLRN